jgi:acetyl-CoA synthetase (ADP-forming)
MMSNIRDILVKIRNAKKKIVMENEAKEILGLYGFPVNPCFITKNEEEAIKYAREIGFPVVLKILSEDIVHKSDAGGVILNIKDEEELKEGYNRILNNVRRNNPGANIIGLNLQKMADPGGIEIIIGTTKDPQFGPVLMFGVGGIFVELFKDVSFRIIPINNIDANEMIREINGFQLLNGYRGSSPVDLEGLENLLIKVSQFFYEYKDLIKEIDLNPVIAYPDKFLIVDARINLE